MCFSEGSRPPDTGRAPLCRWKHSWTPVWNNSSFSSSEWFHIFLMVKSKIRVTSFSFGGVIFPSSSCCWCYCSAVPHANVNYSDVHTSSWKRLVHCSIYSSLVTVHRCHFLFLYCIFFKKVVRVISMHRDPCCLWDANKRVRTTHRCRWHAVVTESTIAYFWNALVQRVLPARAHLSKVLAVARLRALTDAIYIKKLLPFHVKIPTNTPSTATCVCKYTHHHGKVHSCVKPVACFAIRPAAFPLPNWTSNSKLIITRINNSNSKSSNVGTALQCPPFQSVFDFGLLFQCSTYDEYCEKLV